jgi:Zn-dependent protease
MNCQVCQQQTLLPFRCPFCGGQYCSSHRLPENHNCVGISSARAQRKEQVMTSQSHGSYNYSYVYGQDPYKRRHPIRFSQKELKHISIAAVLVIGIGVSIALYGFNWSWVVIGAFAGIMTVSFLVHELAHKVVAQKKGMWAEFRLTTWGALLTFASVFLPFKMIAPGAMMIGGSAPTGKDIVRISLAGPITNIILSSTLFGVAFGLAFTLNQFMFAGMLIFAAYINAFMAVFNLIPFGILDGYKIYSFNKKLWAITFVPSAVLTLTSYLIITGTIPI